MKLPDLPHQDRRDLANYTLREASRWLGLPQPTLRSWLLGRPSPAGKDGGHSQALVHPAGRDPLGLSFWNLVECSVLAAIRRDHGVSMQRVRRALQFVQERLEIRRPLIHARFQTDGVQLFLERYGELISPAEHGQAVMRESLEAGLRRIEADESGLARRLFPWTRRPDEPLSVSLDPTIAFGRLVLTGTGIPVAAVAERFQAGEDIAALAEDYRVDRGKIEDAVRWAVEPTAA